MNLSKHQVLLIILLEKGNVKSILALLQVIVDECRVGSIKYDINDFKIDSLFQLFEIRLLN